MTRGAHAASCVLHSLTNVPSHGIWISDALLADAFRRFTCQHKRHGSNVPGPLEARRRAAKRPNTSLAYAAGYPCPIDPVALLTNRPPQDWWRHPPAPIKRAPHSRDEPWSFFQARKPPVPAATPPAPQFDVLRIFRRKKVYTRPRARNANLNVLFTECRDVDQLHEKLRTNQYKLRRKEKVNRAIYMRVTRLGDPWNEKEIIRFLTDPDLNPPGAGNHGRIMKVLHKRPRSRESWRQLDAAFCKAAELGLISPKTLAQIIDILPDRKLEDEPGHVFHPDDEGTCRSILALLNALERSKVFGLGDFNPDFLTKLYSKVTDFSASPTVFQLWLYLHLHIPQDNRLSYSDVLTTWLTRSAKGPLETNSRTFAEMVMLLPRAYLPKTLFRVTEKLVQADREHMILPSLIERWHLILQSLTVEEATMAIPSAEYFFKQLRKPPNTLHAEERIIAMAWTYFLLGRKISTLNPFLGLGVFTAAYLSTLIGQNGYRLGVSRFKPAYFSLAEANANTKSFGVLHSMNPTTNRLDLPSADKFDGALRSILAGAVVLDPKVTDVLNLTETSGLSIARLSDTSFYLNLKKRSREALIELTESVNSDLRLFGRVSREMIHKDKKCFKIVTRTLRHNRTLKIALSQSHPRRIRVIARTWARRKYHERSTTPAARGFSFHAPRTARKSHHVLRPGDALDMINHLSISFALSKVVPARTALLKVYWCYRFLRRYGAPIQTPITCALWHAGVTRYGSQGCATTQLQWILAKIREFEGDKVANMLLGSAKFRKARTKVLEGLDWQPEEKEPISLENMNENGTHGQEKVLLRHTNDGTVIRSGNDPCLSAATFQPFQSQHNARRADVIATHPFRFPARPVMR